MRSYTNVAAAQDDAVGDSAGTGMAMVDMDIRHFGSPKMGISGMWQTNMGNMRLG